MTISIHDLFHFCTQKEIPIKGILHIGAHDCEELETYKNFGIDPEKIIWIEANLDLANNLKEKNILNVYTLAVDNEEGEADFYVTNNGQSSSLLVLGTHKDHRPDIVVTEVKRVQKKRLATFFTEHMIDSKEQNLWVLDIQGSELNALKSADEHLENVDVIFSEINVNYVYEKCGLLEEMDAFLESKGFKRTITGIYDTGWGDAVWVRNKFLET